MEQHEWDAVIIGAGAAGLSAALMLGRARRRTLVIDAGAPRNRFAAHMHAVLGGDGVPPGDLLARGRTEAAAYGVRFVDGAVADVADIPDGLRVSLHGDHAPVTTRAVVLATGVSDDLPDIPGLADGWGRDVLHCPYCHGWEVRDRRLGVLATSPASLHQIEMIRQWSPDVTAFTAALGAIDPEVRERLQARGIRLVSAPVAAVLRDGNSDGDRDGDEPEGALRAVRTADGAEWPIDAIFTGGVLRPHDDAVAGLGLDRVDGPAGRTIAVDATGRTSHPRVWAAGNVVNPMANVPLAMGAGSFAGAGANGALVIEDAEAALTARRAHAAEWEARYADADRVWSGRVNAAVARIAADLAPGTALDLACGEGGDALWLAERGWRVTGLDLSPTAVRRAGDAAAAAGLDATFVSGEIDTADLGLFDLVTTSFLHSWQPGFDRIPLLRAAAAHVAPGGHLLVVSHAAPPPWAEAREDLPVFASPADELAALGLDTAEWETLVCEIRARDAVAPDGTPAHLDDGVLLLRRVA